MDRMTVHEYLDPSEVSSIWYVREKKEKVVRPPTGRRWSASKPYLQKSHGDRGERVTRVEASRDRSGSSASCENPLLQNTRGSRTVLSFPLRITAIESAKNVKLKKRQKSGPDLTRDSSYM